MCLFHPVVETVCIPSLISYMMVCGDDTSVDEYETCIFHVEMCWIHEMYDHRKCKEWTEHVMAIQTQVNTCTATHNI